MARPRAGKEIGAKAMIGVRVTPELRKRLERRAKMHKRALTEVIREILERATEDDPQKAA